MNDDAPPLAAMDGRTTHVRYRPAERRFSYRLAQILIDIDRVGEAAKRLRLFSHNRFNLFAFHDADHGDRKGAPLRGWVESRLAEAGVALDGGRIDLLCFPRVLGFVFNPVSLFFGYGPDGDLRGVIYEVNNTFGETHAYVAPFPPHGGRRSEAPKRFHVSPFLDVEGRYRFTVQAPSHTLHLTIENIDDGGRIHLATLVARRRALTDGWIVRTFLAAPLSTLRVVGAIHWQALKLWMGGATYRRKPSPPQSPATCADPEVAQTEMRRRA